MGLHIDWKSFAKPKRKVKRGFPTGSYFFTGRQGTGKTLSATNYIARLKKKYPNLYIYSNIKLTLADKVIKSSEVSDYILDVRPDGAPIAFLLDEAHTVFYDKKNKISGETLRAISQQRKAKKTLIFTLQDYLDLDIQYRRQPGAVINCSRFGPVQFEVFKNAEALVMDRNTNKYVAPIQDIRIWKRNNEAFDRYDTYEIVKSTMDLDLAKISETKNDVVKKTKDSVVKIRL